MMEDQEDVYELTKFQETPLFSDIGLEYDPELAPIPVVVSSSTTNTTSPLDITTNDITMSTITATSTTLTTTSGIMKDRQEGEDGMLFRLLLHLLTIITMIAIFHLFIHL